ncbi:biopolymer transport protein ExbD [Pseudomonas cuatrocienegasensis]|uniref:Biopolymer transport protein ExbD n=1 Tax=Pseudomonas cuatrocienegasensis TaxID=543360 RepID=A0ABY1B9Y6_9PSED|nr:MULTISPECIES: TonB system transport protein ExbD [Pseudomonas]OEC35384.1 TonB system transport protein ExbD [Pseudomonas sp. 21C1]SEQ34234.1 biopolymer transport protein ExbD [Pseudomonas cuatrocienegasensis]
MAFNLNHQEDDVAELRDINVTPFIDVMLVLLIIFMVAAPLSTVNMPLELPTAASSTSPPPKDPLIVSLKSDLSMALGDHLISRAELAPALEQQTQGDKDSRIFIRADKSVSYQDLITLMDMLRDAGYLKVALISLDSPAS